MSQEKKLNPMALSAEEASKTLGIPRDWVEEDLAVGAPTNADGTLNLIQYAAWLNLKMQGDNDPPPPKAKEDNSGET